MFLSVASLILLMKLRFLYQEIQRRLKRHRSYVNVTETLEKRCGIGRSFLLVGGAFLSWVKPCGCAIVSACSTAIHTQRTHTHTHTHTHTRFHRKKYGVRDKRGCGTISKGHWEVGKYKVALRQLHPVHPPITLPSPSLHPPFILPSSSLHPPLPSLHPPFTLPSSSLHPPLPSLHPPFTLPSPSLHPPLPSLHPPFILSSPSINPLFILSSPSIHLTFSLLSSFHYTLLSSRFVLVPKQELIMSDEVCAICWEKMTVARRLPCGHIFHTYVCRRGAWCLDSINV